MKILSNFPYSPFTRTTGANRRFLQQIECLRILGHDVTIWSVPPSKKEYAWNTEDLNIAEDLGFKIKLTDTWELPYHFHKNIDAAWINYYTYIDTFDRFEGPKICETYDLLSCNQQLTAWFENYITGKEGKQQFSPDIFEAIPPRLEIAHEELRAYRKCKKVVAISKAETNKLREHGIKTAFIPFRAEQSRISERIAPPCFIGSGNLFNLYGHDLLAHLMPAITLRQPGFKVNVIGEVSDMVVPSPDIWYESYKPTSPLAFSIFGLNPIKYSTGLKIKLVDMMAVGLATVTFESDGLPINKDTGFICNSNQEFVNACVILWNDVKLRNRMGDNARDAIFSHYGVADHLKDIEEVLN